jgi:hypothetical protein
VVLAAVEGEEEEAGVGAPAPNVNLSGDEDEDDEGVEVGLLLLLLVAVLLLLSAVVGRACFRCCCCSWGLDDSILGESAGRSKRTPTCLYLCFVCCRER